MPYEKMTIQQIHDEIEKLNAIKEYEKFVCGENWKESDRDTYDKYYWIIYEIIYNHIDYDKNDDFYIDMKYDKTKIDFSKFNLNLKDEEIGYLADNVRSESMTNFDLEIEWNDDDDEYDFKSFDAKNCIINVYPPHVNEDSEEEDEDECEEGVPPESEQ